MAEINKDNVTARYYPVEPIDPEKYSEKQYLYDQNTLLTQIDQDLKILIEIFVSKQKEQQEKRKLRTIGIHD